MKKVFKENLKMSKFEKAIIKKNDNDKSIKQLKFARNLASDKVLKIIGITMFIVITLIVSLTMNTFDFTMDKIKGINEVKHSFFSYLKPRFIDYWVLYLISYIVCMAWYIKLCFTIKASFESLEDGQKGEGRLATLEEMKSQYKSIPEKHLIYDGIGGVPISRYEDYILIDTSAVNNLIQGTSRSGKGEGFVLIMIDIYSRATIKSSMVINDPKGELCGRSEEMLRKQGYDVKVIDFFEMENSLGYNPLEIVKKAWKEGEFGEAELRCRTFTYSLYNNAKTPDKTWQNLSMNLVNALILALCEKCITTDKERVDMSKNEIEFWDREEKKVNLYAVANMLSDLGSEELEIGTAIDIYFDNLPKNSIAKRQYSNVKFAKSKTRASVFVSAMEKLQVYMSENVAKMTSCNDINLEELGFYKGDSRKAKLIILDEERPLDSVTNIINLDKSDKVIEEEGISSERENVVKLYGIEDIICYKNDIIDETIILNGVRATGVNGQDLTEKIKVNTSRVNFGTPGIYNIEYSVSDEENSKPIALFVIVPDFDSSNHILATTCIAQITYMLSRKSSLSESGKCDREVVFILDEFGNMCPIENFATTLTVCLGRGMRYNLVVQSFNQIKEIYGESYTTLTDACANTIYIKTTDVETAKKISEMSGDKTIVVNSRNGSVLSLDKLVTENLDKEPVIRYDDLINIREGETVVIRPMHRRDLEGNRITPHPIFNTEESGMKFRYEYLNDVFSSKDSMRNIYIKNSFNEINMEELQVDFGNEMVTLIANKELALMEDRIEKQIRELEVRKVIEAKKANMEIDNIKTKQKGKKKSTSISEWDDNITEEEKEKILNIFNLTSTSEVIDIINEIKNKDELIEVVETIEGFEHMDEIKKILKV